MSETANNPDSFSGEELPAFYCLTFGGALRVQSKPHRPSEMPETPETSKVEEIRHLPSDVAVYRKLPENAGNPPRERRLMLILAELSAP